MVTAALNFRFRGESRSKSPIRVLLRPNAAFERRRLQAGRKPSAVPASAQKACWVSSVRKALLKAFHHVLCLVTTFGDTIRTLLQIWHMATLEQRLTSRFGN